MFRRILGLFAALALAFTAGVVLKFPQIEVGQTAEPQVVTVQPKKPTLVCPGPVFVNGGQTGLNLGSFSQSGIVSISGQNQGSTITQNSTSEVQLNGTATGSKNFNAIQTQFANEKAAFGLAAANCVQGTSSAWLVAGANSIGREALLVLANPSAVDATVNLQLYGTSGPIQGAGLSGISAPAGKVTVLPLSSFAPKTETFTVFVNSRGAALGIWLQQKTVRGLIPGGLDLVGVSAEPNKKVTIPGMFLRDVAALQKLSTDDANYSDTKPMLRISAPDDKQANFTAQIQGADGNSFGNVIEGVVPAGSTRDFPLDELTDGNYSITISADEPVVAGVRYSRLSNGKPDFAWAQSVTPTHLDAGFTAPIGTQSRLSVMNPNEAPAEISIGAKTYSIDSNSNLMITLTAGKRYTISSKDVISASQVIDISGGLAVVPVLDFASVGGKLKILVR